MLRKALVESPRITALLKKCPKRASRAASSWTPPAWVARLLTSGNPKGFGRFYPKSSPSSSSSSGASKTAGDASTKAAGKGKAGGSGAGVVWLW